MQKRRWGSYKKGAAAAAASQAGPAASSSASRSEQAGTPFHQQPQHKETIRSQLAGLRHRAAVRANKRQPRWATAATSDADHDLAATEQQHDSTASLDYDSTEMGDGCNMASGKALCFVGWLVGWLPAGQHAAVAE